MKYRRVALVLIIVVAAVLIRSYLGPASQLNGNATMTTQSANFTNLGDAEPNTSHHRDDLIANPGQIPSPRGVDNAKSAETISEAAIANDAMVLAEYEQQFYSGNSLNLKKLLATTREQAQFENLFHALESLSAAAALRDRTQRLNEKVRSLPALQSGAISLQRLACGTRFCAASFFNQDEAAWAQFQNSLYRQLELPEGGATFNAQSGEQGNWEQRLIFSIDGSVTDGIMLHTDLPITVTPAGG
ncbi:MAG: hypothetical protein ACOY3E_07265 [Pseudomonadota bacterium]